MAKKSKSSESRLFKKVLLTDEDLMVLFGVSKATLKRWRDKGFLEFFEFGTAKYYPSKVLKKLIKERTHPHYKEKNKTTALDAVNEKTNDKV